MSLFITRYVGIITSAAARSVYSRLPYFNPVMKSIAARIHPGAATAGSVYQRFPYSNSVVKSIAARSYLTGRTLLDAAYRTIKSWVPKMPVSWSATYANAAAARSYRFPHSNLVVKSIAAHSDPIGRTFLDAAYRTIKPRVSRMPVFWSFTYVNVEKIEGQEKIERIVYPFLFRVTGKDIAPDQKVYLLGMDHSFKEADYPPEALALINACDLLLSEFRPQMALSKNPGEWSLHETINTLLHVHKKLLSVDKEWIGTFLSAYETALGEMNMDTLIPELEEKSGEIKADQARWLDRLSLADQTKIQTRLDPCGLQLRDLDPISVRFSLSVINHARVSNRYDSNTGEVVIINNFQKRNCPIIQLEDELSDLASPFDHRMEDIFEYDLESTLENILSLLEPQVKQIDEVSQGIQGLQEMEVAVPFSLCESEDKCVEFKTIEAFRSHLSLVQMAEKQTLLRSVFDDKIYFNFEEYEEKWLAVPSVTYWTTIYRNNTWHPKTSLAIQQKKDTAIICGDLHLIGETGMVRSLRRDGYDVEHVKFLEK